MKPVAKKVVRILSSKTMGRSRREEAGEGREQEIEEASSSSSPSSSSHNRDAEYVVEPPRDRLKSSRGSRFKLLTNEFGLIDSIRPKFSRESLINNFRDISRGSVVHPESR